MVGPNGSGKSNVVDALAWVMGEQGVKNLRGGNMADVIFAGTAARPALGRAEVSLTIDNTDGALPIDYSEVTITRTLFRSGGSEYAINGTPCRLLDIQELLSDTGMGKEMHVIIGQGKLDEVLAATPEERRGFIEEAAGVLKHRKRKEKALRKLEAMQADLLRIEDISAELRRQLGPLARQAAAARRAQVIQSEVFAGRARILADDIAQAQARLSSQNSDSSRLEEEKAQLGAVLTEKKAYLAQLQQDAENANPHLAALIARWQQLASLVERYRGLIQLAQERMRSLEMPAAAPTGEDPEQLRQRAAQVAAQTAELEQEIVAAQQELQAVIAERETKEAAEKNLDQRLGQMNRSVADRRETAARLGGKIAAARSRLEAWTEEYERVQKATAAAQERVAEAAAQIAELEQDAVAQSDGGDDISQTYAELAGQQQKCGEKLETARKNLALAQQRAAEWQAKADTLQLSLAPEDATAWVVKDYRLGVSGLVRDHIKIQRGWEAALEAALQGIAGGALISDTAAAVDALRAARSAKAGHLELLITDAQKNSTALAQAAVQALQASGFSVDRAQIAGEVLLGEDRPTQALREMLAGTLLCVDLVTAKELLACGAPQVATAEGDLLSPHRVAGGEVDKNLLLSRQSAFAAAVEEAEKAKTAVEKAAQALESAQAEAERVQSDYENAGRELNARDARLAAVTAQLGVLRQSLAAGESEVERNQARAEHIRQEQEKGERELAAAEQAHADLGVQPQDLEKKLLDLQEEQRSAHIASMEARGKETEARLLLRTREERLRPLAGKVEYLEKSARIAEEKLAQAARAAARRAELHGEIQELSEQAGQAFSIAEDLLQAAQEERTAADAARLERDTALRAARQEVDELAEKAHQLEDLQHQRELARTEMRIQYEQLAAKSVELLGVEPDTLIEEYGPHLPIVTAEGEEIPYVRATQEQNLARAEKALARLGKINPLALEEHAALEERQKYLTTQLQDLRRSRADLLQIIEEIDARVEGIMQRALADVAKEFQEVFSYLFPGGEGKLELTDSASPLTAGVDIFARPPGKRVKRLSLLSGGERSLTAIAFLMAIFKARPSPFYVLDEVEAALDDTNLSRLLELFRNLQRNSQLLIITHQKRTMEIADVIYGVAMREQGVTSVISQRLPELLGE